MKGTIYLLRMFLGIIFIWYGSLKFFPNLSPAEALATKTIDALFFGMINEQISIKLLAAWEVAIGIGLLLGVYLRYIIVIFLVHMTLTFSPFILFPELTFTTAPYGFTLVGQYIVKNIIFIMCGIIIYKYETDRRLFEL